MKKFTTLAAIVFSVLHTNLHCQIEFIDMGLDKNENRYIVGNFEKFIDVGNKNLLSSGEGSGIFISKYDIKSTCQWGTKITSKEGVIVSGIYVEPSGNFYITGSVTGEAKFGVLKTRPVANKIYPGCNMFIAKYNISGDPIWVKTSKNQGRDAGYSITGDNAGNIFVIGAFDNKLVYDNQIISSKGKNDVFILKINSIGNTVWLKNYGDIEDESGTAISVSGNKLIVGGWSSNPLGFNGLIYEINSENGSVNWTKNIGKTKGSVEKIIKDNTSA